jgi:hypothetical protein
MRYSLKEGVVFGVVIGAAVLLIRTFVGGPPLYQLFALVAVAVVLAIAQLLLGLRRAPPPDQHPPATPLPPERMRGLRRGRPQDPFARENNQAWTGLSTPSVQEQNQRAHADADPAAPSAEPPHHTPGPARDAAPPANRRRS